MLGFGKKSKVCIVGGGFAGLNAAQHLKAYKYDVTLIDPSPFLEWLPNVHEILSGKKKGEELRLDRGLIIGKLGHTFIQARVVDVGSDAVTLDDGRTVHFDACIVSTGAAGFIGGSSGVEDHALSLKSVASCQQIAQRLRIAALGHKTVRVSVVGGGVEGVEAFGEILRAYRYKPQFEFNVVDSGTGLLNGSSSGVEGTIKSHVKRYSVDFHFGKDVSDVDKEGLTFQDGSSLESDITIWSGGETSVPLHNRETLFDLSSEFGRINSAFQSRNFENVFVVGDAAGPNQSHVTSKQVSNAIDKGKIAAGNASRLLAGRRVKAYRPFFQRPELVAFGDLDTFVLFNSFALSASVLGAAREAVFTLGLLQLDPPRTPKEMIRTMNTLQNSTRGVLLPALNPLSLIKPNKLSNIKLLK